ncbi:MAG: crossover junction endodeoxyribonuclease RuvC [Clostridiales bacterium]|nr:crossover junction endodeoxyribonuclease RuvC [Candidatus Scatonaster coprocaballi]
MVILGIDPGYAITGYGVVSYERNHFTVLDYGAITTKAHTPFEQRLLTLHQQLDAIIARFQPEVMAIEELFFQRNTTTAIGTAQARGVLILAAAEGNIPVYEYTPMQIKQAVTGYGRADKNQVSTMVKMLLNLESVPKPDDVTDALAIAICQAHTGVNSAFEAVAGYQYGRYGKRE